MPNRLLYGFALRMVLLPMVLLLDGCANTEYRGPQQPELLAEWTYWQTSINASFIDATRGSKVSGRLIWYQRDEEFDMSLRGPFNITVARLFTEGDEVVLHQRKKEPVRAKSVEALSFDRIGTALPFSNFPYWLKGIPTPAGASNNEATGLINKNGRNRQWQQAGWTVNIHRYRGKTGILLPEHISIHRGPHSMDMKSRGWRPLRRPVPE
jgi:outer membrane lipoprotein LolB